MSCNPETLGHRACEYVIKVIQPPDLIFTFKYFKNHAAAWSTTQIPSLNVSPGMSMMEGPFGNT